MSKHTQQAAANHLEWLEAIEREGVNLSTWEEGFISDIGPRLRAGRTLTDRQAEILEDIYTNKVP